MYFGCGDRKQSYALFNDLLLQMRSERSTGSSPDVHQLPAQLYYESVQLNMSPVDEVNVALRHDVANWLETTTMKSKKLDAECKFS